MKFSTLIFQAVVLVGMSPLVSSSAISLRDAETMVDGINCRGSVQCVITPDVSSGSLDAIISYANKIDPNRWYNNGDQIVCHRLPNLGNGICAFLQTTNGAHGYQIRPLLLALRDHGCTACGSVPFRFLDGINDANNGGWVTVNYVAEAKCTGVC